MGAFNPALAGVQMIKETFQKNDRWILELEFDVDNDPQIDTLITEKRTGMSGSIACGMVCDSDGNEKLIPESIIIWAEKIENQWLNYNFK